METEQRSELLGPFREVEGSDNVSCLLSLDLTVRLMNPACERFALEHDAALSAPGAPCLLDVLPEALRDTCREGLATARRTRAPWVHEYACDDSTGFRVIAYPFDHGFIVTQAPVVDVTGDGAEPPPSPYEDRGVMMMCSHCRRVLRVAQPERWDWVPAYVTHPPPQLSHGLCPPCYVFYYPE